MLRATISDWKYYSLMLMEGWEIKGIIACSTGFLSELMGISPLFAKILVISMIIDFFLGMYIAVRNKNFRCNRLKKGISKMGLWVFYIILMSWGDSVFQELFGLKEDANYLAMTLTASIIFTELSSIIKHCQRLNLPMPETLLFIHAKAKREVMEKIGVKVESTQEITHKVTIEKDARKK